MFDTRAADQIMAKFLDRNGPSDNDITQRTLTDRGRDTGRMVDDSARLGSRQPWGPGRAGADPPEARLPEADPPEARLAGPSEVRHARLLVAKSSAILVLTGAGISTDSGIPDFRGPQGLWTRDPEAEKLSSIEHFVSDPEVRRRAWLARLASPVDAAEPNAGHRALADLERRGTLDLLVTQNIDGLHLAAGNSPGRVVEIHGSTRQATCLTCGARWPIAEVLDRVRAGDADPRCTEPVGRGTCGGLVKAATISFGQPLVEHDLERAERAAARCDLVLAIGTTLSVYPAAGLVPAAKRAGATLVIVNGGPTEMDGLADAVVRGSISEVLPAVVGA